MQNFMKQGLFIAVEGPNGVGKSTLIDKVAGNLLRMGCKVLKTKEPTETELGQWIRKRHDAIHGRILACLIAADRYEHIETVIQPALDSNTVVLSDRYLASSFVYQVADGVPVEFVRAVNSDVKVSDLTVCIFAEKETIAKRMKMRKELTRFEKVLTSEKEIQLYRTACEELRSMGWAVAEYVNEDERAEALGDEIANRIIDIRKTHQK